jgi:exopolysaccharide biosynthesis polyprenyl glycosylphosphotransferase
VVNNRSIGIRTLALACQLAMVTLSFWGWLFIWQTALFDTSDITQRYLVYNEFLLVGILLGCGGKREASGLHHEWVQSIRQSFRQAFFGLFSVFVIVFALHDVMVSRSFFFSYVPCLYLTLLFSNYLVPRSLGRWAFSGAREERVALAGTVAQAIQLEPWLERKRLLGLKTIGLIMMTPGFPNFRAEPAFQWTHEGPNAGVPVSQENILGLSHASVELGQGCAAEELAASAETVQGSQDIELEDFLQHDRNGSSSTAHSCPYPILGAADNIDEILRNHSISQLILLDLSAGKHWVRTLTQHCEAAAVRLLAVHNLDAYFNHKLTTLEDDGLRFVCLREEPLESPVNRFFKRVLDLALALPIAIFVLPVTTFLVWTLQRLHSPGPIFFRQVRTGMMGQPFTMLKYRTMHSNNRNEAKQASKNDPRIYAAGRWLRKFSVDELPQVFNVLRGEMSVVGPRPHLPEHEEMFVRVMSRYPIRRFIRPGLTGWAQVNGFRGEIHSEIDIQTRVEADIHYLENWSFSMDCLIILKTVKQCLFPPPSAY